MSQQSDDSLADQSAESSTDSPTPPEAALSVAPSVDTPPERELDLRFSRMSVKASLAAPSQPQQPQDQPILLLPPQPIAAASSNAATTGAATTPEAADSWLAISTPALDVGSLLSDSDSITWTDTVSPNFPDERLVAWASSTFMPNLTTVYGNVISTPVPTAGSSSPLANPECCRPRRVSRPSPASSGVAVARPAGKSLSVPSATYRSNPAVRPSLAASSQPVNLIPASDATRLTAMPAPAQPVVAPSYTAQPQPYRILPPSPTYTDFHAQRTIYSSTGATVARIYHRIPWAAKNCPYSRPAADGGCRVAIDGNRFPPAARATGPVAAQSYGVLCSAHPAQLQPAKKMAVMLGLRHAEAYLEQLHQKLALRQLQWGQMERSGRHVEVCREHKVLLGEQIREMQGLVSGQEKVVRNLRLFTGLMNAQVVPIRRASRSEESQGQPEMRVERNEQPDQ